MSVSSNALRDNLSKAYANFNRCEPCLVMIKGQSVSQGLLDALSPRGFCLNAREVVCVAGDTYSFFLLNDKPEEEVVSRFDELSAEVGSWLLATKKVRGNDVVRSKPGILCFYAVCEALRETESRMYDGIAYWTLNPFAALIKTVQWLETLAKDHGQQGTEHNESTTNKLTTPEKSSGQGSKKRGRKNADYETITREAEIAEKWNQARDTGTYKAVFAKDNKMTLKEFDRLLGRVDKRNKPLKSDSE